MARKLKPCGTAGGYSRHKWRKEEPCDACRTAWSEYQRNYSKTRGRSHDKSETPRQLQPCGTYAAAQRHKVHGEPVCDACADAVCDYAAEWARNHRAAERARREEFEAMFAAVVAEVTG